MMVLIALYVLLLVWLWWPRTTGIPKIIWSFWDGEQPPIVKACIDSWKRMAPDYEIRLLDKESTKDIQQFKISEISPQRYAEFVRLDRLSKYGGVWIDASVYLTKPLDWIQDGSDFVGYKSTSQQVKPDLPIIDSWFFACKKGSEYVMDWYEEMKKTEDPEKYLESLIGVDYSKINGPSYLVMHVASMAVRTRKQYSEKMTLIESETEGGKIIYSRDVGSFCDGSEDQNVRLIKLTSYNRKDLPSDCEKLKKFSG
jgi:hypothetical protein